MNSKSLRRLAGDHGALHAAGLPPNYLFPPDHDASDLSSLDVLLAGPVGTPYTGGVWRLHLDIPPTYPAAPPTAQFRTRLWHPNIDEATGAVCVETLKRDWSSALKLRDVLVTISCLLIHPNPASALNEAAGKLASEDWPGFCRRAALMTEIHAAVPTNIAGQVKEAQMRGEDTPLEAGPVQSEKKPPALNKGKGRVRATPAAPKVQRLATEDEENTRRRGETPDPDSDPESDWIPGPENTSKPALQRGNILGITGLGNGMQLTTPPKSIYPADPIPPESEDKGTHDDPDPFITVISKRTIHTSQSFDLRLPTASSSSTQPQQPTSADTPDLLKLSHQTPFSSIQTNNRTHPLLEEFSFTWEESEILHDTDLIQDGVRKLDVRKRMAAEDFERKREWEMKRFKRAGYDLGRYNRGDFGPSIGMGRL
ncbi:ubiquitin-conjugating enzyme/RWD-like protein [Ampelomyces quisqualis]|uniref:Ubiquitin-conjugating enzyme/RWD-like protein n=1 Tax=Ampelomyces quisqualis TaxID=50730 RepID=A0A6A5Q8G3_AMPQU|nr:ubiquitin-conjugating enzyme/RWD-like protein [Ampelomyces quisqualis]